MSKYTAEVTQWGMWEDTVYEGAYRGRLHFDGLVFLWLSVNHGLGLDGNGSHNPDSIGSKTTMHNQQGKRIAWSSLKDAPAIRAAIDKAIDEAYTLCREIRDASGDPTRYLIDIEPDRVLFLASRQLNPNEEPRLAYKRRQDGSVELPTEASLRAVNK